MHASMAVQFLINSVYPWEGALFIPLLWHFNLAQAVAL